jgi:hypothetical protein
MHCAIQHPHFLLHPRGSLLLHTLTAFGIVLASRRVHTRKFLKGGRIALFALIKCSLVTFQRLRIWDKSVMRIRLIYVRNQGLSSLFMNYFIFISHRTHQHMNVTRPP